MPPDFRYSRDGVSTSPRDIVRIYTIQRLQEKGWTNKKIASHLGMTPQNLSHILRVNKSFVKNLIVERLLSYDAKDPELKQLLKDASVNLLRMQELVRNAIDLQKEEPPATLQG